MWIKHDDELLNMDLYTKVYIHGGRNRKGDFAYGVLADGTGPRPVCLYGGEREVSLKEARKKLSEILDELNGEKVRLLPPYEA